MRKFVTALILIPLTIVIIAFAIANREIITVSFDPFDSSAPAHAVKAPLFIMMFMLVGVGAVVGGVAAWLRQHKWRVRARRAEAEARELRAALEVQRAHGVMPAPVEAPPLAVPPAA